MAKQIKLPVAMQTIIGKIYALGIPEKYIAIIEPYAEGKESNLDWIKGVLALLDKYQNDLKNPDYDHFIFQEKLVQIELTLVNPETGMPYGFGSLDLTTGQTEDNGQITGLGAPVNNLTPVNQPSTTPANYWPYVLGIAAVLYFKK
jgi:hypothetical protein